MHFNEDEEQKRRYILMIPFVGKPSLLFKHKISKIFKDSLKIDVSCVFDACKVGDYFSLKSKTPALLLSNVVYKFNCQGDPASFYIGETNRHIITRVEEHKDCFSEKYPTAIGRHIQDCEACLGALRSGNLSYKNFEIISRCRSKLNCEVKEAVSITKLQPPLNKQLFQSGHAVTLKIFG